MGGGGGGGGGGRSKVVVTFNHVGGPFNLFMATTRKLLSLSLDLFFKVLPACFPYIVFYLYLSSLLSCGWFVIAVCGSISVQGTS